MKPLLPFWAVLLLMPLDVFSQTQPQRDSTEMLRVCRSFIRHRWKVDKDHIQANCTPEKWAPSKNHPADPGHYKSQFFPDVPQKGVAYAYGDDRDAMAFDKNLGVPGRHLWEWPQCNSEGVDCSAFVSRAWGIARAATTELTKYAKDLGLFRDHWNQDNLQRGDALDAPNFHVILFDHYTPGGDMCVYEATPPVAIFHVVERTSLLIGDYKKHPLHILRYAGGFAQVKGSAEACPNEQLMPGYVHSEDTVEEARVHGADSKAAQQPLAMAEHPILIELSSNSLKFVDQKVGASSSAQYVKVTIHGADRLPRNAFALTGQSAADFSLTSETEAGSDSASKTLNFAFLFHPVVAGDKQASLSIRNDKDVELARIVLAGRGVHSCLKVDTADLDLGFQYLGGNHVAAIAMRNCGTVPVSSITIRSALNLSDPPIIVEDLSVGDTIRSVPLKIHFNSLGQYSESVRVTTDGVVTGPLPSYTQPSTLIVKAFVEAPALSIEGAAQSAEIMFNPAQARTLILHNSSHLPIRNVTARVQSASGEFTGGAITNEQVDGSASLPIQIRFTPTEAGLRRGSLIAEWTLPDGIEGHASFELRGTAASCVLLSSPGGLDFGRTRRRKRADIRPYPSRTVVFSNCGDVPVTVQPIASGLGTNFVLVKSADRFIVVPDKSERRLPDTPAASFVEIAFQPHRSGRRNGVIAASVSAESVRGGQSCPAAFKAQVCLSVAGTGEGGVRALVSCWLHHCD